MPDPPAIPTIGTRALRRGRWSVSHQIYHVTTATHDRHPLFADLMHGRIVINALRHEQSAGRCSTLVFVLMPDHLHWLMQLSSHGSLSGCVNNVKTWSACRINAQRGTKGRVWQKGFYDRAIRKEDDLVGVARYIVANPLRSRIAQRLGDYPHWDAIWV